MRCVHSADGLTHEMQASPLTYLLKPTACGQKDRDPDPALKERLKASLQKHLSTMLYKVWIVENDLILSYESVYLIFFYSQQIQRIPMNKKHKGNLSFLYRFNYFSQYVAHTLSV